MESWQEKHILANLVKLITVTECTVPLMDGLVSNRILSPTENEAFELKGRYEGNTAKASALYKLLLKRKGAYNLLISLLRETYQDCPADILEEARSKHVASLPKVNLVPEDPHDDSDQSTRSPQVSGVALIQRPRDQLRSSLSIAEAETQTILDFMKDKTPLDVCVVRPVVPMSQLFEDDYNLPAEGKGYALILNITEFENPDLPERNAGGEKDLEYMSELWPKLGYKLYPESKKVREQKKKYKEEIKEMIGNFKEQCERSKPASVVVFIGSHGRFNTICTSDPCGADGKPVTLNLHQDIVSEFSHEECPVLEGKPKIFLIQACQDFNRTEMDAVRHSPYSDAIICTPQVPGYGANRDKYKGSWFIYCLTYILMKYAHQKSFRDILDLVKVIMEHIDGEGVTQNGQVPTITDMNLKTLYFFMDP